MKPKEVKSITLLYKVYQVYAEIHVGGYRLRQHFYIDEIDESLATKTKKIDWGYLPDGIQQRIENDIMILMRKKQREVGK